MITARCNHHPMRFIGDENILVLKDYGFSDLCGWFLRDLSRILNRYAMTIWRMDRDWCTVIQCDLAIRDSLTPRLRRDVREMSNQVFQNRLWRGVELRKMEP